MLVAKLMMELNSLKELAARFRRRHHYMCRGPYSVKELILINFAAETADSLAQYVEALITEQKILAKTEPIKKRSRELQQECHKDLAECRWREIIEELEELEFEEILIFREQAGKVQIPIKNEVVSSKNKTARSWKHEFLHVMSYEKAGRIDITSGEDQDIKNMRSAFLIGIRH